MIELVDQLDTYDPVASELMSTQLRNLLPCNQLLHMLTAVMISNLFMILIVNVKISKPGITQKSPMYWTQDNCSYPQIYYPLVYLHYRFSYQEVSHQKSAY